MAAIRWVFRLPYALTGIAYAAVSVALWPLPVLGILHVGSSTVIAGVAFFAAGLAGLSLFRRGEGFGTALLRHGALLLVPLVLLTATLLWRPNCGYAQGLLVFVTFTLPSVALAVALAYALDSLGAKGRHAWFVLIGILVATLPVVYDLRFHPQLYTYNHVWGGVLGTVYDEELVLRPGLFFFRGLTLWWAAALFLIGERIRLRRTPGLARDGRRTGLGLIAAACMIAGTYAAAPWLGINSPSWYIQQRLGGHLELDRFDVYYDPEALSEGQLGVIADLHAYRYERLSTELGVRVPHRIATYIYPDVATKAALTGSRVGGVAPTWLPVPQLHIAQHRFEDIFAHELAHVMAREFGMPIIRASPAAGLIEGLAMAVEPPDGLPDLHAQVAAALRHRESLGVYGDSLSAGIAAQLRPLGFWTGRGAVSYVTMGSFVRYLLDSHGREPVQDAYRTGRFEAAFGRPVDALAREWERFIRAQEYDEEASALVHARFTRPSLFERRCPHHVPAAQRRLARARAAMAADDTSTARREIDAAFRADSTSQAALAAWAAPRLGGGEHDHVRARLERAALRAGESASIELLTRLADAYRLEGADAEADSTYAAALRATPPFARTRGALLELRRNLSAETLGLLLEPLPRRERAEALEQAPRGAAYAALILAELGDFERAATLIRAAAPDLPPGERFAWQSAFTHAAGDRRRAAELAEQAAAAFDAAGAGAAAERQRDRAAMLWRHALRPAAIRETNVQP